MDDWQDLVERIQQPEGRGHDPLRRQVRRVRGLLQEHQRGALPRRVPPPAEGQAEVRRGRGARTAGRAASCSTTPSASWSRPGFGDRGSRGMMAAAEFARTRKIPYFGICYGFQWAVVEFARNVAGLDGRRLDRGRRRHAAQGHLQAARPARRRRHGRHDAARQLRLPAGARLARLPALRRGDHPRAPPPSLRVQLPLREDADRHRPAHRRPVARRQVRRDRRAAGPPVVRGRAVPPRVQVEAAAAASAVRRLRRGGLQAARWRSQGVATNVTAIGDRRASG